MTIALTESAANRIKSLIDGESRPGVMFRLSVSGGGCSGFQYGFALDDRIEPDDRRFDLRGVALLIDEASLALLEDAEIDYVEDLMASSFRVRNPQAASTCGCGNSFSL